MSATFHHISVVGRFEVAVVLFSSVSHNSRIAQAAKESTSLW